METPEQLQKQRKNKIWEAIEQIVENLPIRIIQEVQAYLDAMNWTGFGTVEHAKECAFAHLEGMCEARISNDNWCDIYLSDLYTSISPDGTPSEQLNLLEKQVVHAYIFGYVAGIQDLITIPAVRNVRKGPTVRPEGGNGNER